ncbi:MAG TPA: M28 family peptidase [Bryobacteraceae bacterium]|nr:M28 family peptidase [Bryobacteraceae bacterium]
MHSFLLALLLAADLTPQQQSAMDHISAQSLRGHLSFIASDVLEGRATPSRGLDLAAEYIASQFRRAGLEPVGDDGYFQTATLLQREPNWEGFDMTFTAGGKTIRIDKTEAYLLPDAALNLRDVPVIVADQDTPADRARGKVVFLSSPRGPTNFDTSTLVIAASPNIPAGPQVRDPEAGGSRRGALNLINKPELAAFLKDNPDVRLTLHMAAPIERPVKVHNVAALLRGSDPQLNDTYVLLTAHYDHLGTRTTGDDKIFNGANDDGSGTVSVVEIAAAMAALPKHPARSILFMTFFGEERGLVGSRYYGRHPLVPLEKTIADLNLEQIGRTDASDGPQIGTASITGFDFSELPGILADAGKIAGIKVYKNDQASDPYFARSDNQALADVGIPAHTLCVAFDYPDYHKVSDHWEKVDYTNMAKVDRAVALALLQLASDAPPPKWNDSNPKAKKYADAAKKLHP